MSKQLKAFIWASLIAFFGATSISSAYASELITSSEYSALANAETIQGELQKQMSEGELEQALIDYGVSPELAKDRIANMTDAEAQQLAAKIEELPAAGSELTVLLLVVIIVLLLGLNN